MQTGRTAKPGSASSAAADSREKGDQNEQTKRKDLK